MKTSVFFYVLLQHEEKSKTDSDFSRVSFGEITYNLADC